MAATDEFKEAGLGVPMRLAVQNAINGKHNLDVETANHFARVTGHSSSGGWGAFSKSLTNALLSDDDPSLHVGEMVEALGFHENNFSSHFETHKFDQKKQDELRDELHEVAAFVGAHVEDVVNSVREAIANPEDQELASSAYEAGYRLADVLHQTHAVDEEDNEFLSAEVAHQMTQTELKNYQSPISFHPPENIGGILDKAKQKARQLRRVISKNLIPEEIRRTVRNRNVKTNSSVVLGDKTAIPYIYLRNQCIARIPSTTLGATEAKQFGIVTLSTDRATVDSANKMPRYLLHSRDIQYPLDCAFSIFMEMDILLAQGVPKPADPSTLTPSKQNVFLYRNPGDLQPSATGVVFSQSDVPAEKRIFAMPKDALVNFKITVEVKYPNGPVEAIEFNAVKTKFDPNSRGSLRVQEMIGLKMLGLADNQYEGYYPGKSVKFLKGDDGYVYWYDYNEKKILYVSSTKENEPGDWVWRTLPLPIPYELPADVASDKPSPDPLPSLPTRTSSIALPSAPEESDTIPLSPENETEDAILPPPAATKSNPVSSFSDLMNQKQMMVMQFKLHDAPQQKSNTRPFLNMFITRSPTIFGARMTTSADRTQAAKTGFYQLEGIMLVLPRMTKKRDFPQSVRNTPSTRQRGEAKKK